MLLLRVARFSRLLLAWGGLAWAANAVAQEPALRQLADFWAASVEEREAGIEYRFEVDVLFYDPEWEILQVQDAGLAEFLQTRGPLPLSAGQRVILEGRTRAPGATFWVVDPKITVVGEAATRWHPINAAEADHRALLNYPVEITGLVEGHTFDGPSHLQLNLVCDGVRVNVWVLLDPYEPVPTFDGLLVRVRGVDAARFDGQGKVSAVELFCPGLAAVEAIGPLGSSALFARSVTPVAHLRAQSLTGRVKVQGRVVRVTEEGHMILRDDSGQVEVETAQQLGQMIGQSVAAVGVAEIDGITVRLVQALVMPIESGLNRSEEPVGAYGRVLHRITATALELAPEQAARNHPVKLNGVVTWSSPRAMMFYLQDSSGGIGVYRASSSEPPPVPGRHIEVDGVTVMGDFAPSVQATEIRDLGAIALPRPRRVTLEQALTGVEEAQWVEMSGFVHRVRRDGGWARLEMTSTAGPMIARLPGDDDAVAELLGSVISVRGVCSAISNEQRRLTGIELWVSGREAITVLDAGGADFAAMPTRSLDEVGRFSTAADQRRRIKVAGTVLHWEPDGWVYLENGSQRLAVQTRQAEAFARGSKVEAAGFQGREGGRTVLRECIVRKVGEGSLPAPTEVADLREVDPTLDGRLVRLGGEVVERFRAGGRSLLAVQDGRTVFECEVLEGGGAAALPEPGSVVRVEGVYEVTFDDRARPVGFRLLVDNAGQVELVEPPPWWTRERVVVAAGILIGGVLLVLGWGWTLQQRVAKQAYEINDQMRRASELEAELQQALRLESLGTLAGGVAHDFNRRVVEIMDNLASLKKQENLPPAALEKLDRSRESAIRARDLAHRLLTVAKGGEPKVQPTNLVELVTQTLAEFSLPQNIEVQQRLARHCETARVDPWQMKQLLQNLLLNAVQAMPHGGAITVELEEELREASKASILPPGRYLCLVVRDNGEGIPDRNLPQVFDPYFTTRENAQGLGLAVVYSIARRHGGLVTLNSKAMVGTEVKVWVPVG